MLELLSLYVVNSLLSMGILAVLVVILNHFRVSEAQLIPRLVLRTREARKAAGVLVVGLMFFLASHLFEMYGAYIGSAAIEALHETAETISLIFLFASHLWFWRIVRLRPDPRSVVVFGEGSG